MAIPAGVQKIVLFGDLPGGEIWETGFWLQGGLPESDAAAQIQAQLVFNVLESESDPPFLPALAGSFLNSGTRILGARCYAYPTGGSVATYSGEYTVPTPIVGSSGGRMPNQVAGVITLRTAQSGRSYRGRMYCPANGAGMGISGAGFAQFPEADCQTLVNNLAAAFNDLAGSSAGVPVVVSATRGVATVITNITMDTRADIQRRRANREAAAATVSSSV